MANERRKTDGGGGGGYKILPLTDGDINKIIFKSGRNILDFTYYLQFREHSLLLWVVNHQSFP